MRTYLLRLALPTVAFVSLATLTAHAQPASATFRPALVEAFSAGYSYTAETDLDQGGGTVAVQHVDFSLTGRSRLGEATTLLHGLAYARHGLDTPAGVFLPDSLEELTLSLGVQHRASAQWMFSVYLRPGIYSDGLSSFESDSFNAPLLAMAIYSTSRELSWIMGFSANAAADNPFMPIAGVRWQYAPDWTLNIGFPRAGVTYRQSDQWSFNAGATVQGGDYYLTESLGVPAPGIRRLARTWLEYREIRLGLGAELTLRPHATLSFDTGVVVDQRFDYYDRGYKLKGNQPWFTAVAFTGRF